MTDIFISYSHKDEAWKDKIQAPLRALQLHNDFDVWDDRQIGLGDNWLPEIEGAIEQARVAVLLVSNDFLMSDFVVQQEIPRLLQRRADEGLRVVPVVVRPCPWQGVPWLAELQGATKDNRPLSSLQGEHEQEEMLSQVALKIFALLNESKAQEQQEKADHERQTRLVQEREAAERRIKERQLAEEARQRVQAEKAHNQARTKQQAPRTGNVEREQVHSQVSSGAAGSVRKFLIGCGALVLFGLVYALSNSEAVLALFKDTQSKTQAQASLRKPQQTIATDPVIDALPENKGQQVLPDLIEFPHNMKLVKIPQGDFQMGSDKGGKPVHTVTLHYDFWMSQTEVTFAQYDAYVVAMGKEKPGDGGWGRNDHPAINVSWQDIQAYVKWLSGNNQQGLQCRLPSEAEWEYAARAGSADNYSWGNEIGKNNANCDGCGSQWDNKQTAPVASFKANPWGLYDMHGNVWEWVQDRWHSNYQGAPIDGAVWESGESGFRVLRGGSWSDPPNFLRSANRNLNDPDDRNFSIGFRIVCSPPSAR